MRYSLGSVLQSCNVLYKRLKTKEETKLHQLLINDRIIKKDFYFLMVLLGLYFKRFFLFFLVSEAGAVGMDGGIWWAHVEDKVGTSGGIGWVRVMA